MSLVTSAIPENLDWYCWIFHSPERLGLEHRLWSSVTQTSIPLCRLHFPPLNRKINIIFQENKRKI
jgi:hypothetical protein